MQWTHCTIHGEASKQLSPELKDAMTDGIAAVNYPDTRQSELGSFRHRARKWAPITRSVSQRGPVASREEEIFVGLGIFLEEEGGDLVR